MTTARDICERSLRTVNISPVGQSAAPEDVARALVVLNQMIHSWNADGYIVEWSDKALSDTIPWPQEYDDGLVHALAGRLIEEFSGADTVGPLTYRRITSAETKLRGRFQTKRDDGAEYF